MTPIPGEVEGPMVDEQKEAFGKADKLLRKICAERKSWDILGFVLEKGCIHPVMNIDEHKGSKDMITVALGGKGFQERFFAEIDIEASTCTVDWGYSLGERKYPYTEEAQRREETNIKPIFFPIPKPEGMASFDPTNVVHIICSKQISPKLLLEGLEKAAGLNKPKKPWDFLKRK